MAAQEQRVTAGVAAREPGEARVHEKYQRLVDSCAVAVLVAKARREAGTKAVA